MSRTSTLVFLTAALAFSGCSRPKVQGDDTRTKTPEKIDAKHLPNAYRIQEKVISGGQPEGEAAFRELRDLGVKTIVSVDGATPDVERARKFGMRYVHLPFGYDGIPKQRIKELAKAVRDLEGPIYIHCHHGKHRSPTAAAVACVAAGLIEPGDAVGVLETAGTSEHYRGLYQAAREAKPLGDEVLDHFHVKFPETAELPPMAEAMVAIEHTFDRLGVIAKAGWLSPPGHPDLEPAHEALILREHFTELLRTPAAKGKPERFRKLLQGTEKEARALEDSLRAWEGAGNKPPPPSEIASAFGRIADGCKACHQAYRDVPLREKGRE
jgi:protein tyrosine phosphatase (PTP) superfamily phosphohydrolase (DUF442 family)